MSKLFILLKSLAFYFGFIFLVCSCFPTSFFAQTALVDTILERRKQAQNIREDNPSLALRQLTDLLNLAQKEQSKTGEMMAQEGLGFHYFLEHQLEASVTAYQIALNLSIELDSIREQGANLNHLANAYYRLGRIEKALDFTNQAYPFAEQVKDTVTLGRILILQGIINTELGFGEKALGIYLQAYSLFDKIKDEAKRNIVTANISYHYLVNGKGELAIPYIQQTLAYYQKQEDKQNRGIAISYGNLGYAYFLTKNFQKAYGHYQIGVEVAKKNRLTKIEYNTYKDMSDTYLADNNPIEALVYFKKYHQLRDSVIGAETQNRIADLEVKFETVQKENTIQTLRQEKRLQRLQIFSLGGGIVLLGLLAFSMISRMRNNLKKKQALLAKNEEIYRLEKELMENQLQQKELEQQKTEAQLAYKTQHLTNFALDITQKNQFSNKLMEELQTIEKEKLPKKVSNQLRHLRMFINSSLRSNDGIADFQQQVKEVNLEFNRQLEQRFPILSKNDLILCGLLRLNLQNKEIATIRAVSDNAIKMARYRLRKKLSLTEGKDIVAFLQGI